MKTAVLSIPGLPNGWVPLSSKLYHNYESILAVIEAKEGKVDFNDYLWPKLVKPARYAWASKIPLVSVWAYYALYSYDANYRRKIVDGALSRIRQQLAASDKLYLILHSHGTRIGMDALLRLETTELIDKEIILLCFAPAYYGVGNGAVPSGLEDEALKEVQSRAKVLNFRMKTDLLSGIPPLKTHSFKPRIWELFWLGHSTIRFRGDVMRCLAKAL